MKQPKTKTVKVTIYLDVEEDEITSIEKITHHAEYLLDLDNHPEIKSVYGVEVNVVD